MIEPRISGTLNFIGPVPSPTMANTTPQAHSARINSIRAYMTLRYWVCMEAVSDIVIIKLFPRIQLQIPRHLCIQAVLPIETFKNSIACLLDIKIRKQVGVEEFGHV